MPTASATLNAMRLPGVTFLPPPPVAGTGLPPLDVAGFVGFAERGPLDLPVPLDSAAAFTDVFGGDLPLTEADDGTLEAAYLPGAAAAFFANGGRRCYVVRVAGPRAGVAVFAMPGLAALSPNGARAASLSASSPGRWADVLRLNTRLVVTPLPPTAFTVGGDGTLTWRTGGAPSALEPGDLLRLTFDDGAVFLFPVASVGTPSGAGHGSGERRLSAESVFPVFGAESFAGGPREITALRRLKPHGAETLPLEAGSPLQFVAAGNRLMFATPLVGSPPVPVLQTDDLLALDLTGPTETVLLSVLEVKAGMPPTAVAEEAVGMGVAPVALLAHISSPPVPLRVERLRLGLLVEEGTTRAFRSEEMGFAASHSRFWGEAVVRGSSPRNGAASAPARPQGSTRGTESRPAFEAYQDAQGTDAEAARRFRALHSAQPPEADADVTTDDMALLAARFAPLKEADAALTFLPVGMKQIFTRGGFVGPAVPGDDGLEAFSPALFLDPALAPFPPALPASADGLLAEANALRFLQGKRLRGLHALLFVEEVALVSVPDALHPGWPAPSIVAPFPPVPPESPPAMDGSRFRCCEPPAPPEEPEPEPPAAPRHRLPRPLPASPDVGDDDAVLILQHAALQMCLARRDATALFALPRHYEKRQCIAWQEALRRRLGLPPRRTVSLDASDVADLSYAAVFHPWLLAPDGTVARSGGANLRATPPDGAICGLVAARERQRGVWGAPANVAVAGALDLTPAFTEDDWADLFALQFNLIRREPRDFRLLSAHTLSDEAELLQLSVRRLMILLRKAAFARGMTWVFEPDNETFRESVRISLEAMLREMYRLGAFRGDTEATSFRVNVGPEVNPPESLALGRFVAQIQVAPSQPMEFITVLLLRAGTGALSVAEA